MLHKCNYFHLQHQIGIFFTGKNNYYLFSSLSNLSLFTSLISPLPFSLSPSLFLSLSLSLSLSLCRHSGEFAFVLQNSKVMRLSNQQRPAIIRTLDPWTSSALKIWIVFLRDLFVHMFTSPETQQAAICSVHLFLKPLTAEPWEADDWRSLVRQTFVSHGTGVTTVPQCTDAMISLTSQQQLLFGRRKFYG